ncbi:hypothetical protein PGT21_024164 [Puccinia graminis f. sp. tritici]|uniref:Major facilitator superfamily (MFS) profile domain-containing protein n=1 Tax=Puccinia graminis f. sp. tritici TaxID=56615 RepID=A0A5B0PYS4_PUCGR|nr:hypothetical protein PGT21_024164 [Puccinia graminis f. sp. tritici]KAA1121006.1 hypothetical protein PGTUg99_026099 [Puccinia graminis f. sp. tritici]
MPSGAPFGRCRFNSSVHPIIEIATYQHAPSMSTNNQADIALTASPYKNNFKDQRPYTAESDNRTVCLDPSEQPDTTFQKKYPTIPWGTFEEENDRHVEPEQHNPGGGDVSGSRSTLSTSTKRLDLIILPLTSLIYLSDYVQRSNIGNAAVYSLKAYALDNSHWCYALVLSSFSITYLSFSIGANIVVPKSRSPKNLLSCAVLITSIATIIIGFASNFATIFICRSFIGMGGAILGKSMESYYSLIYTRTEMAKRMSFFIGSTVLAGALNGIFAYGTGFIKSEAKTWRFLFFIEGAQGIVLALACLFCLPSSKVKRRPETTSQVQIHTQGSLSEINSFTLEYNTFEWRIALKALLNPNIWISSFSYGCVNLSVGSLTGYLPRIMESFGHSPRQSQLLTAWPYLVAFVVMFLVANASDRTGVRSIFVIIMCTIGSVGWTLLLRYETAWVTYFATFLVVAGAYCPIPLILSWTLSNCTTYNQRAASFILMQTFGQVFTVFSNFIFHALIKDSPQSILGYFINLVGNASAVLAVSYLAASYRYHNWKNVHQAAATNDRFVYFL